MNMREAFEATNADPRQFTDEEAEVLMEIGERVPERIKAAGLGEFSVMGVGSAVAAQAYAAGKLVGSSGD